MPASRRVTVPAVQSESASPESPAVIRAADRWSPPPPRHITVDCGAIDAALVKAGVYWLAAQADQTRLDAVIVVPSLADAVHLACAVPEKILSELLAGNMARMNRVSVLLLTPSELMPSVREHHIVLALGLTTAEVERVNRMTPAASFVVRIPPPVAVDFEGRRES